MTMTVDNREIHRGHDSAMWDDVWSAMVHPRHNRISVPVPDDYSRWSFRVVLIPVESNVADDVADMDFDVRFRSIPAKYASADWDDYGAKPLDADSYEHAARFVRELPASYKWADVGVDADGEVTLEWYHSADRQCSLTFATSGSVYLVMRVAGERTRALFSEGATDRILDRIDEVANG